MIVLDVGGSESMGVVWDLIVTRVAGNNVRGELITLALSGLTGLQTLDLCGTLFMLLLLLCLCLLFACF